MKDTLVAVGYGTRSEIRAGFKDMKKVGVFCLKDEDISYVEDRDLPDLKDYPAINNGGCAGKNDAYVNAVADVISDCEYLLIREIGGYPSRVLLRRGVLALEQEGETNFLLTRIREYIKREDK